MGLRKTTSASIRTESTTPSRCAKVVTFGMGGTDVRGTACTLSKATMPEVTVRTATWLSITPTAKRSKLTTMTTSKKPSLIPRKDKKGLIEFAFNEEKWKRTTENEISLV